MNPLLSASSSVCIIIGDPVAHSVSPRVHNAGYAAAGVPFVMVGARVAEGNLHDAFRGVRALGIRGVSITMPHKIESLQYVDQIDPLAQEIGAINTVVNTAAGQLVGYNTDWVGIVKPIERHTSLKGKSVAILGAGGAAQAAIFAATKQGAAVTLFNRTASKAQGLAKRWNCQAEPLTATTRLSTFDVVINTTSVGMGSQTAMSPVSHRAFVAGQIVFDTIYAPLSTQLLTDAQNCKAQVISGAEMFLEQAIAQFELHTGSAAPRAEMERSLREALSA